MSAPRDEHDQRASRLRNQLRGVYTPPDVKACQEKKRFYKYRSLWTDSAEIQRVFMEQYSHDWTGYMGLHRFIAKPEPQLSAADVKMLKIMKSLAAKFPPIPIQTRKPTSVPALTAASNGAAPVTYAPLPMAASMDERVRYAYNYYVDSIDLSTGHVTNDGATTLLYDTVKAFVTRLMSRVNTMKGDAALNDVDSWSSDVARRVVIKMESGTFDATTKVEDGTYKTGAQCFLAYVSAAARRQTQQAFREKFDKQEHFVSYTVERVDEDGETYEALSDEVEEAEVKKMSSLWSPEYAAALSRDRAQRLLLHVPASIKGKDREMLNLIADGNDLDGVAAKMGVTYDAAAKRWSRLSLKLERERVARVAARTARDKHDPETLKPLNESMSVSITNKEVCAPDRLGTMMSDVESENVYAPERLGAAISVGAEALGG